MTRQAVHGESGRSSSKYFALFEGILSDTASRTERTYVKGLQELVDIYIKPAAAPVTSLSGAGQSTVPSAERKIVFGGLEALFSFHKESFLPALERVSAPVMRSAAELAEVDPDGSLSLKVARAVANIFVSHAAFMKMYSTYIKCVLLLY